MGVTSQDKCQLLGPTSIVIQLAMGMAIVAGLLLKRNREHPRRKMVVWAYDVGKQLIGALEIHFINLGLSIWQQRGVILFSGNNNNQDDDGQCDWYFLNLLCDTTIGIPILWVILVLIQSILVHLEVTNIESGNYFSSASENKSLSTESKRPLFSAFLKQSSIFVGGISAMKFIIYELLEHYEKGASWFANLLLGWCDHWPNFQVFVVMFVCPVGLNFFQYFCVDNIIKLPTTCVNSQNLENFEPESLEEYLETNVNANTNRGSSHAIYGSLG
ncbi:hypothetical protein ZYGR_0S02270 [Zygosaccharomyces rouxii]|uniref:ZYRO0F07590p n=2 Tax=Zygosaccharomyces rouxii TaxID=4956 RepID=C5DXT2_ZYGRC|nr:uncharacterized protein ZYRO0F07590g [Zygosaccharomyces rouxii]KAH9199352.1 vacuolar membrane protein-domain-containing protein [Zygosaccharomyces rouxii]GAV50093.1 hypothetical protein ZYGR_0S02270 [Zygosaccharomyces rouxii]CAR28593.1 ZYRO0F07590p [Zygosaccharomyces rouxii]